MHCSCNEGALVAQINDLQFWKTTYIYKDLTEVPSICVIFVYAMPPAGTKTPNVLNASSTNCNCPVREQTVKNAYTKREIEIQTST